jgi:hypothetical protein
MLKFLIFAGLIAAHPVFVAAQDAAAPAQQAAGDEGGEEEEEAPAPAPAAKKKPAKAPAGPNLAGVSGPMKQRLAEISKVHKNQLAFGAAEGEVWKGFWTKLRDERALFEMRLVKQREGFMESLRSLDARDHYQSLQDFEALQNNVMNSFEESQQAKIAEFIAARESKIKEFGAAQEGERARLAQESTELWDAQKAKLDIQPPSKEEQKEMAREKDKEAKAKKKKKGD